MRDDPIVFEDWKIGRSTYVSVKSSMILDFIMSLIFISIQFTIGLLTNNATMVFVWIFSLIILIVIEIVIDQMRTIMNRFFVIILLVVLSIFTTPSIYFQYNDFNFLVLNFIAGTALMIKMTLIYIIKTEMHFNDEILIPRSEYAFQVLNEQILRVQDTDYELMQKDKFGLLLKKFKNEYLKNIISIFTILIIFFTMIIIEKSLNEIILLLISFIVIFVASIFMITLLAVWYFNKRRIKKKVANKLTTPLYIED